LQRAEKRGWHVRIGSFAGGMIVGMGNEQVIAGMTTVLIAWGWMLWRSGRLRELPDEARWALAGLTAGTLILIGAPGNYNRLGLQEGGTGLVSTFIRFGLYLGGAYFALGTGDEGRSLWFGIAILALTGMFSFVGNRGKEGAIWIVASLATLAPMLPLINFASPRTTLAASILLVIAVMTVSPRRAVSEETPSKSLWAVAMLMAILIIIDGFVGWTANRSFAQEMQTRLEILRSAAATGKTEVALPYLATIPSRLTYMLNPIHDQEFGTKLAASYGLRRVRAVESPEAVLPNSRNSLKALKNSF